MQKAPHTTYEQLEKLYEGRRFNSYSTYFRRKYGERLQKVTINAGMTCPNRDGTKGVGGCTFCINEAFTPSYCSPLKSIRQQIEEGIEFHQHRYRKASRYLAYFQSYSNSYAPLEELKRMYGEALEHEDVAGIIIGTRPDCIDEEKLDYLAQLAEHKHVTVEYGVESTYDETLKAINRGHDFECAQRAVAMTAERGLECGAHFILGFPGESESMLQESIARINEMPLSSVKFHQLQIFKGTEMAREWVEHRERFVTWSLEEYIEMFIGLLERLRPEIVVERFAGEAPPRYHLGGNTWGLIRNETILSRFEKRLQELDTYQGRLYQG